MARSIMAVMQENVNPVSTANALYELMIDWRSVAMATEVCESRHRERKLRSHRSWTEKALARFFCIEPREMRELLQEHFDIVITKGPEH